jgi:hypothetical protein
LLKPFKFKINILPFLSSPQLPSCPDNFVLKHSPATLCRIYGQHSSSEDSTRIDSPTTDGKYSEKYLDSIYTVVDISNVMMIKECGSTCKCFILSEVPKQPLRFW